MTVISELFNRYESERYEGKLQRIIGSIFQRSNYKLAKEIMNTSSGTLGSFKIKVLDKLHQVGVDEFIKLYDDKLLKIAEYQVNNLERMEDHIDDDKDQLEYILSKSGSFNVGDVQDIVIESNTLTWLAFEDDLLAESGIDKNDPDLVFYRKVTDEYQRGKSNKAAELSRYLIKTLDKQSNDIKVKIKTITSVASNIRNKKPVTEGQLINLLGGERPIKSGNLGRKVAGYSMWIGLVTAYLLVPLVAAL